MLSEALDITIESRGDVIWLALSGHFNKEQVPNIRMKLEGFIQDGHREIVVDLEGVTVIHESAVPMFLSALNLIKGKPGDIKLIFKNETVTNTFLPYKNLFAIYPDPDSVTTTRFLHSIRRRGLTLTKKTGIRLSVPVALFLLFILTGWFISLGIIINMQRKQLSTQELQIRKVNHWKEKTSKELSELRSRIKPLKQLGLILDSIPE